MKLQLSKFHPLILVAAVAAIFSVTQSVNACGMRVQPQMAVDLVINQVAGYIKAHPKEAKGYYMLGRVHTLAYIFNSTTLPLYNIGNDVKILPKIDAQFNYRDLYDSNVNPFNMSMWGFQQQQSQPLTRKEQKTHFTKALKNFNKAIALDADSGLYRLGMAYLIEKGGAQAGKVTLPAADGEKLSGAVRKEVDTLIVKLGDRSFKNRRSAQEALERVGAKALPTLEKHLNDRDPERRSRVRALVKSAWHERAIAEYLKVYRQCVDGKKNSVSGSSVKVGYCAGLRYKILVGKRGASSAEKKSVALMEEHLAKM